VSTPLTPEAVNDQLAAVFPSAYGAGLRCEEIRERGAVARWKYDPATLRPGDYISGPTMFSIADVALWFGVFGAIGIEPMAVTSEMSIRFLRPAVGGDLLARSVLHAVGRRRIVGTVEIWVDGDDRLVAVAQGTYARPDRQG
jgi:uncharacterized protein (TIGR00369 family)